MAAKMWIELNSSEIKDEINKDSLAMLPVGSCEQHGMHLPVGTDLLICNDIVLKAAQKANANVLILPSIAYGFSHHHLDFAGTISLNQLTLVSIIKDICDSLHKHRIRKVLIVNCHGGNQSALQVAINEVGQCTNMDLFLIRYWDLIAGKINQIRESKLGGMGHAGELETSIMEYLDYKKVKQANKRDQTVQGHPIYNPDMFAKNPVYIYRSFKDYSDIGVIGDSTLASAEKGGRFIELIIKELSDVITYIAHHEFNFKN